MSRSRIKIVLVRPRDPNNIGAVARAMKNFGLRELAVVAPYRPTWEEVTAAVKAEDVLTSAAVYASLAEAVADCTLVVGTADPSRVSTPQLIFTPADLAQLYAIATPDLALVFGPEKHGLTNDDLSHCHRILSIPTSNDCPSMNLGQAVAICCYELRRGESFVQERPAPQHFATAGEIEMGLQLLLDVMREVQFIHPQTAAAATIKLRQRLLQLDLTPRDVNLLCGVLRQIQWRFTQK